MLLDLVQGIEWLSGLFVRCTIQKGKEWSANDSSLYHKPHECGFKKPTVPVWLNCGVEISALKLIDTWGRLDAPWNWVRETSEVMLSWVNTLRLRQHGHHFAHDAFKCVFLNGTVRISIKISLKFVPKGPINNIPALVQRLAWHQPGDKPLSEPMRVSLLMHICVARPQWVNKTLHYGYVMNDSKIPYFLELIHFSFLLPGCTEFLLF